MFLIYSLMMALNQKQHFVPFSFEVLFDGREWNHVTTLNESGLL